MKTTRRPARVISPGKIISRELEARGWSQRDLAEIIGRPYQAVNEIIKGSKQITPDTARELARAFGTSIDFWMNLEANYRLFLAEQEDKEKEIERRSKVYSIAPVRELTKRGWIPGSNDVNDLEQQVCSFLGTTSIDQPATVIANLRISESRGPEDSSKIAWLKRVEHLARQQPVAVYDPTRLRSEINRITEMAQNVEDVTRLPETLRELGVHFLVVPHLPHTYLDGAALFVDKNPVIAVTLRYDRIDWFWFTILHEWAHIVLGHSAHLDSLFSETTEDRPRSEQNTEAEANEMARRYLLDPQALEGFIASASPYFSKDKIEAFAAEQKRHPGIVLGQLQHQKVIDYKHLRSMLVKVKPYLEDWVDTPGPAVHAQ